MPIKGDISCLIKSVIFLITCLSCVSYVEKLSRALKTCIAQPKSTIRCKNINYTVAAHFVEFNHPISSLRYIGTEKVSFGWMFYFPGGNMIEFII